MEMDGAERQVANIAMGESPEEQRWEEEQWEAEWWEAEQQQEADQSAEAVEGEQEQQWMSVAEYERRMKAWEDWGVEVEANMKVMKAEISSLKEAVRELRLHLQQQATPSSPPPHPYSEGPPIHPSLHLKSSSSHPSTTALPPSLPQSGTSASSSHPPTAPL